MVIKGLPANVTVEEIKSDLLKHEVEAEKISQFTRKMGEKEVKLTVFSLVFKPGTQIKELLKIKRLCFCTIQWERYKNNRLVTQCFNCQGFHHIADKCHKKPRCLKCAGDHNTKNCSIAQTATSPICANCGGEHMANSVECEIYKTQVSRRSKINNIGRSMNFNHNMKVNQDFRETRRFSGRRDGSMSYSQAVSGNSADVNQNNNDDVNNDFKSLIDMLKGLTSNLNLNNLFSIITNYT